MTSCSHSAGRTRPTSDRIFSSVVSSDTTVEPFSLTLELTAFLDEFLQEEIVDLDTSNVSTEKKNQNRTY